MLSSVISGFAEAGRFWNRRELWRRIVSGDPEDAVHLPVRKTKMNNCHCRKHPDFFYFLCAGLNSFLLLCPFSPLLLLWDAVTVELGSAKPRGHTDTHF